MKYQVFALGGSHDGRAGTLFETLRRRVTDLGLSPTDDVELVEDPDVARIDTSRAPTARRCSESETPVVPCRAVETRTYAMYVSMNVDAEVPQA